MDSELEALFSELLEIEAADTAFEEDFADLHWSSPHDTRPIFDKLVALGPAIVPALIRAFDDRARRGWAISILRELGPAAGPAAFDALVALRDELATASALWTIDPVRARAFDLHRDPRTRERVLYEVQQFGIAEAARLLAHLLEDLDPEIVAFALGDGAPEHPRPAILALADRHPDLVPVDLVRAHAARPGAIRVLAEMHQPEDAALVLDAFARGVAPSTHVDLGWVGGLAESERMFATCEHGGHWLIERRRAAGLPTDLAAIRAYVDRHVAAALGGTGPIAGVHLEAAIRAAGQVRDVAYSRTLRADAPRHELLPAFEALGDTGRALAVACIREDLQPWARREIAAWARPGSVDDGDALLREGILENPEGVSAYRSFAAVLQLGPDPYAALQLAWIDRAFGTPIAPPRLAWLHTLGMHDAALLDELATPIPPMPGPRFHHRHAGTLSVEYTPYAVGAEAAGLPSIAARYWNTLGRPDDEARARAATEALLARLHGAV